MLFNKKKIVYTGRLECFTIIAFIQYLQHCEDIYDSLVDKGHLPEEDKFLRREFIKAFKLGQLVDVMILQEEADLSQELKIRREVN